jgi:UDP-2-acetamido-3-amino-2,3-dideoxy-glucuronate N-acetyltransferase
MASRVAVVGCGAWGRNLVRNFSALGALAAISDRDTAVAAGLGEKYGVAVRSLPEILADDAIGGVVIAAPAADHAILAAEALAAGKHVFVEKPLALTTTDGEDLCARADAAGRVLMVGHLLQYHPAFLRLKALVREGALGRLQYIYSHRLNLGKMRREENILWSFAPHDISMILSLVGAEPESVTATGSCYLHKTIADVTTTHLSFPGGESAHVFVSWLHPFKEQMVVVVADAGMAVFNDLEPWERKLVIYPHRVAWKDGLPVVDKADGKPVPLEAGEPLEWECRHFLACMAGQEVCRTDGAEGLRVLRVLEAAQVSMASPPALARNQASVATPLSARTAAGGQGVSVHDTARVDEPSWIGERTRIWHFSHVLKGSRIGARCRIGQNVMIGPDVTVGDDCAIQNNVSLYKGVTLEDGVFCGPSAVFTNVLTPRAEIDRKDEFLPTRVRRGATIGANATIVCGVELGAYCLVAAGAVVTRDVPAFALVAGVPARRIGWVGHAGERLDSALVCPRTGRRYAETGSNQLEEVIGSAAQ